jgi:flavin-binding protein dodecin
MNPFGRRFPSTALRGARGETCWAHFFTYVRIQSNTELEQGLQSCEFKSSESFPEKDSSHPHVSRQHWTSVELTRYLFNTRGAPASIACVAEIKASSAKSYDDALRKGVARANNTLKNVKSSWIENQDVMADDKGEPGEY